MLIGTRTLQRDGPPAPRNVEIQLFAPEQDDHGWFCRYTIAWPDEMRDSQGRGYDALQAVWLTLSKIGGELYGSAYYEAGQSIWDQPGRGYGFPVASNMRDVLVGDDARYF